MTSTADTTTPISANNLTESEATWRASLVSEVDYVLQLQTFRHRDTYTGDCTVTFTLDKAKFDGKTDAPLFLDFIGKRIESIVINDQEVSPGLATAHRLLLPTERLVDGRNTIRIRYVNGFDRTGDGFHKFLDVEDQNEYHYTNFEPFDCHRLLPCFDQPSLKATLTLQVTAPAAWIVLANDVCTRSELVSQTKEYNKEKQKEEEDYLVHTFATTPRMSTYLFALAIGPYVGFKDSYVDRVPLRFFCRKSLEKHLQKDVDELFTITKQGFKFYEDFFGLPFPFSKYDQIFVPEMNTGAMENTGLVTINEVGIFREPTSIGRHCWRADVILHELSHMYFGNLVSPIWWDGLWLNESFATFIAALCTACATEYKHLAWQVFNSANKLWAYEEDQLSTTHAVQCAVKDTNSTFLNFDGVTYGKGSALLKQLVYMLGQDRFKAGIQLYFKKHAWGNTSIVDFLACMASVSSDLDAKEWSREFLEKPGLNQIVPALELSPNDQQVASLTLEQSAPSEHPTLRRQFFELAFFDFNQEQQSTHSIKLRKTWKIECKPLAATRIREVEGEATPAFLFVNYNDHGYAKVLLDTRSQAFVSQHLHLVPDTLLRQQLWTAFFDMTRDAKMSSLHFLQLVRSKALNPQAGGSIEADPKLLQTLLRQASTVLKNYVPKRLVVEQGSLLFSAAQEAIKTTTDEQCLLILAEAMAECACSREDVGKLVQALSDDGKQEDKRVFGSLVPTQKLRWEIVKKAVAHGIENAQQLVDGEARRDSSDTGQRCVLTCRTSVPDAKVKEEAWGRYVCVDEDKKKELSYHQLAADMSGFRWHCQEHLLGKYANEFFAQLRAVFAKQGRQVASAFMTNLMPFDPEDQKLIDKSQSLLAQLQPDGSETILCRMLKEQVDDLIRARQCRLFALNMNQSST